MRFFSNEISVWWSVMVGEGRSTVKLSFLAVLAAAIFAAFLFSAQPALAAENCETCHDTERAVHPVNYYNPYDEGQANAKCLSCHPWEPEAAVPGPVPMWSNFAHENDFWPYGGFCTDCHWDDSASEGGHNNAYLGITRVTIPAGIACSDCHTAGMADVPQVDGSHGDPTADHAGIPVAECASCHGSDVAGLHADCGTCHNPTPPAGATCLTCHGTASPRHEPTHDGGLAGETGCARVECHSDNVVVEHVDRRALSCSSCHDSTEAAVVNAIAAEDVTCDACHTTSGDHAAAHQSIAAPECIECHSSNVFELHPTCATCHDDAVVAGSTCVTCHAEKTEPHGKYAGYSAFTQYVPWAEAQELASANADGDLMATGPHSGYATTTVKCAVCHSVHRGGSKLLNEGSGCAYCHTSTAHGGGAVASNLISWDVANQGPHSQRCTNDDCHGGPHGVGASQYDGPASRLISARADSNIADDLAANGLPVSTLDTWNAQTRAIATGGLCSRSGCHTNSMFSVVTAGAEAVRSVGGQISVTGHRVIADATTSWNADGSFPSTRTNIAIAFKPVDYCNSCHDLKDDNNGGKAAFPHAIDDVVSVSQGKLDTSTRVAVWLTAAPDADSPTTVVGRDNSSPGDGETITGAAGPTILDGVCLKCHLSGSVGVGLSY